MRIGIGYDIHRLIENRDLIIGGVLIPYHKGLLGHSDADVLCHAIMDALLGAANLGDIGKHFPDWDDRFKSASSIELMEYVTQLIEDSGYQIVNIDTTIMAEEPKMASFIDEMKENVSKGLGIEESQVSIKATTTEKLGAVGAGAAIATQAVVLIDRNNTQKEGLK